MSKNQDAYKTIKSVSEGFYKEKGSKFLAFAIPCSDKETAKQHIDGFRKEHHNACHVCFAWRFGTAQYTDRYSDDGEPNNSAGKPIFGQILSFEVTNTLIAVVRYYGGTNLGVGGLITAYKTAAKEALENAKIVEEYISSYFMLEHEYSETGTVMSTLNKLGATISEQGFENNKPSISFKVERYKHEQTISSFEAQPNVSLKHLKTE